MDVMRLFNYVYVVILALVHYPAPPILHFAPPHTRTHSYIKQTISTKTSQEFEIKVFLSYSPSN